MNLMETLVAAVANGDLKPSQVSGTEREMLGRARSLVSRRDGRRIVSDSELSRIVLTQFASSPATNEHRTQILGSLECLRSHDDRGVGDTLKRFAESQAGDVASSLASICRVLTRRAQPLTLDQLNSWYPYQRHYEPYSLDPFAVAVTSVSPLERHSESQGRAFDSWKRFGFRVVSINTPSEVGLLADRYPQIDEWIACSDEAVWGGRSSQKVRNLLGVAVERDSPVFVINSDIEIAGSQESLLRHWPDANVTLGIRWNYESDYGDAVEFEWGFDVIGVTPEHARKIPVDFPYGIGQPVWDYAAPMLMSSQFNVIHERLFFHRNHPLNWNDAAWSEGAKWFEERFGPIHHENTAAYRKAFEPEMVYDKEEGRYVPRDVGGPVLP